MSEYHIAAGSLGPFSFTSNSITIAPDPVWTITTYSACPTCLRPWPPLRRSKTVANAEWRRHVRRYHR